MTKPLFFDSEGNPEKEPNAQVVHPTGTIFVRSIYYPWNIGHVASFSSMIPDNFFYQQVWSRFVTARFGLFYDLEKHQNEKKDFLLGLSGKPNDIKSLSYPVKKGSCYGMVDKLKSGKVDAKTLKGINDHVTVCAGFLKTVAFDVLYLVTKETDDAEIMDLSYDPELATLQAMYKPVINQLCYGNIGRFRTAVKELIKAHPGSGEILPNGYKIIDPLLQNYVTVMVRHLIRDLVRHLVTVSDFNFRSTKQLHDRPINFTQTVVEMTAAEYQLASEHGGFGCDDPFINEEEKAEIIEANFNFVKKNVQKTLRICSGNNSISVRGFEEKLLNLTIGGMASADTIEEGAVSGGAKSQNKARSTKLKDMGRRLKNFYINMGAVGQAYVEQKAANKEIIAKAREHIEKSGGGPIWLMIDTTGSTLSGRYASDMPLTYVFEAIAVALAMAARKAEKQINIWFYDEGINYGLRIEPECTEDEFQSALLDCCGHGRSRENDEIFAFQTLFLEFSTLWDKETQKTIIFLTDDGMLTANSQAAYDCERNLLTEAKKLNLMFQYQRDENNTTVFPVLFSPDEPSQNCQVAFEGFKIAHIRSSDDFDVDALNDLITVVNPKASETAEESAAEEFEW